MAFSASAGTLTPPSPVAATFYTLTDIYELITNNTTATEGDHDFTFSDALSGSGYTLTQIYEALANLIDASTVLTGNTYLGVAGAYDATNLSAATVRIGVTFGAGLVGAYPSADAPLADADSTTDLEGDGSSITSSNGDVEWWSSSGTRFTATLDFPELSNVCDTETVNGSAGTLGVSTSTLAVGHTLCGVEGHLLKDLFNGSSSTAVAGGSQSAGGVDDYNGGGTPPPDAYRSNWLACTSENNYCGTGSTGADAQDLATGLVWSKVCGGIGCTTLTEQPFPNTQYTWDNSHANNDGKTAYELCSQHTGWALPHLKQWMQAYINGGTGIFISPSEGLRTYWTATTVSINNGTQRWFVYAASGENGIAEPDTQNRIRCVWAGNNEL